MFEQAKNMLWAEVDMVKHPAYESSSYRATLLLIYANNWKPIIHSTPENNVFLAAKFLTTSS